MILCNKKTFLFNTDTLQQGKATQTTRIKWCVGLNILSSVIIVYLFLKPAKIFQLFVIMDPHVNQHPLENTHVFS